MRGHTPVTVEDFKGLWHRGNNDECPLDHGLLCRNVKFGISKIVTRPLWGQYYGTLNLKVRRSFVFNALNKVFIIFMTYDGTIYTQQVYPTISAPVLRVATDDSHDMDYISFNNRAYIVIAKFGGYLGNGMYVFDGAVWKAAGYPSSPGTASMSGAAGGNIVPGVHYIGFAVETKTGFISRVTPVFPSPITIAVNQKITIAGLPNPASDPNVQAVRIIATKAIAGAGPFLVDGLVTNPSFFVPGGANGGVITSGTTATINFYDSELLNSASYLQDVMAAPPGGSFVTVYHNRLVVGAAADLANTPNPLLIGETRDRLMISRVNDPETFEIPDGLLLIDPSTDSIMAATTVTTLPAEVMITGLTDGHEYRDNLYVGKLNSMYALSDNSDVPSSWSIAKIDDGIGCFQHGIVTILDSGGTNVEYMLIANKSGLFVFNGIFNFPEVTWKISNIWSTITKHPYKLNPGSNLAPAQGKNHLINDPFNKVLYILVSEGGTDPSTILYCDYSETTINDAQYHLNVKWSGWNPGGSNIVTTSIFAFDTGLGTRLFAYNRVDDQLYELGIASAVQEQYTTSFSGFTTAFIKDPSNAFVHTNGFSLMQVGHPTLPSSFTSTFFTRNSTPFQDLPSIAVPPNFSIGEKIILANHTAQALNLRIHADYFDIRRINVYVKPTFRTIPQ